LIDGEEVVGASIEDDAKTAECLIELGTSLIEVREGRCKDFVLNDSQKFVESTKSKLERVYNKYFP